MVADTPTDQHAAADWDVYWQGTREQAAHAAGGPQDQVLAEFWQAHFSGLNDADLRILDLAAGNGAVSGFARQHCPGAVLFALDYSHSALQRLRDSYGARVVAADAGQSPFGGNSFDIVASQFGIEYAGPDSLACYADCLAPGGQLIAVMHLHDGAIYRECALNLSTCAELKTLNLLPLARAAFAAGFDVTAGRGDMETFKAAEATFKPAVRGTEALLQRLGQDTAAGLPNKIYQDIAHMYKRMRAYEASDVLNWVDGMEGQLQAYAGRMQSMLDAALDETAMSDLCGALQQQGLHIEVLQALCMGPRQEKAAWQLRAAKPA